MDEFEFHISKGSLAGYLKIGDIEGESLQYLKLPDIPGESQRVTDKLPDIAGESLTGVWGSDGASFEDPLFG